MCPLLMILVSYVDFSRFTMIYLMTINSYLFKIYDSFRNMVQIQFSTTVKVLRSDLRDEYLLTKFTEFLSSHGTIHQSFCSDTPT